MTQKIVSPTNIKLEKIVAQSFENLRYLRVQRTYTWTGHASPILARFLLHTDDKIRIITVITTFCSVRASVIKLSTFDYKVLD